MYHIKHNSLNNKNKSLVSQSLKTSYPQIIWNTDSQFRKIAMKSGVWAVRLNSNRTDKTKGKFIRCIKITRRKKIL